MAQKLLIIGESGTGKTASIRDCDPATTAIVSPEKERLSFRAKGFEILKNTTDSKKICDWMRDQANAGKKIIVVDDFQYILAFPYMERIHEGGWDKWNDFSANYFNIIEVCKELPEDVVVAYLSHGETLPESGLFTVKLIGKMLREKITIEGMFDVVLRTAVQDGKYYFLTQNSGHDTVKSPMGMFNSYAIDNDLNYVVEKIRNYYFMDGAKSDEEIAAEESAHSVSEDDVKPKRGRRGKRSSEQKEETTTATEPEKEEPQKLAEPEPDEEKPRERKRKKRTLNTQAETLAEDTYYYLPDDVNVVMKHKGEEVPEHGVAITKEQFEAGCTAISKNASPEEVRRAIDEAGFMNIPEGVDEELPFEEAPEPPAPMPRASRRRRRSK